jgi:phosphomevalonate kinase
VRVAAPGKLLLSGAYAVLEGAPALVVAVDRMAIADGSHASDRPTPEVLSALSAADAPRVDASRLRTGEHKLGLGSSAAILVASLGVSFARAGRDLADPSAQRDLFLAARRAHAAAQGGGSGVDVAASVYGGAFVYAMGPEGVGQVEPISLPDVLLDVFWLGSPAVTSGMRERVDGLKARASDRYKTRINEIAFASAQTISAARSGDAEAFILGVRETSAAMASLGRDADAPIIPPKLEPLLSLAHEDGAAFVPSGAGGGDVFVHVGRGTASPRFRALAASLGISPVTMGVSALGAHFLLD